MSFGTGGMSFKYCDFFLDRLAVGISAVISDWFRLRDEAALDSWLLLPFLLFILGLSNWLASIGDVALYVYPPLDG